MMRFFFVVYQSNFYSFAFKYWVCCEISLRQYDAILSTLNKHAKKLSIVQVFQN